MKLLERLFSYFYSHKKNWRPQSELIEYCESRTYTPLGAGERGGKNGEPSTRTVQRTISLPPVPFYSNEHGEHIGIGAMTINPKDLAKRIQEIEDEEFEDE